MAGNKAEWDAAAQQLRARIAAIPADCSGDAYKENLRAAFSMQSGWSDGQDIYTVAQLDKSVVITACREGILMWWQPLAAATYFGRLDDLRDFYDAMKQDPARGTVLRDFGTTLSWGCWDYSIVDGLPPAFNPDVLNQLFDWGADVHVKDFYNSEEYYDKALRTAPAPVIRTFLDHGASPERARSISQELVSARNHAQARKIQDALGVGGFYTKVDDRTLMETKYIAEPGGDAILRTVFNFAARRINEVFEFARGGVAMTSCNFEDYDQKALHVAEAKLEKLGGRAGMDFCPLDKPRRPHL